MAEKQAQSNRDFDWDRFDPDAYFNHNYSVVRSEDLLLAELAASAFSSEADGLNVLDVGTGSNLYPVLAALARAKRITAWDFSAKNIAWLRAEIARPVLRDVWGTFWGAVQSAYSKQALPANPAQLLQSKMDIQQGSLFDLPEREWDASTMFFCAESLTEREEEFVHALRCWACAVKAGGLLVGAFIESSAGYSVGPIRFPAFAVNEQQLTDALSKFATVEAVRRVAIGGAPIRPGYSGMLFATARAK